ncbi:MAG TPA: hypothetical protein VFV66_17820 [Nonomuraea sp.]|nr:hypothetical protein [Nonomuraea sp.]
MAGTHEMVMVERIESGEEVWDCPECGRRLLLRWPPDYSKQVLVPGDESVGHSGATGGVRVGAVEIAPAPDERDRRWLRDSGIDWEQSA